MNVYYWNKEIPSEICKKLISLGEGNWDEATIFGSTYLENNPDITLRKSNVVWVSDQWIYDLIWPYMMIANEQAGLKYNIVACEDCQVTRYTEDGFYAWHNDGTGSHYEVHNDPNNKLLYGNVRKLSMTIVLNSNFEDGDFEIGGLPDVEKIPRLEEGSIIFFPSFMEHRVVPVTKGTRYSLVAWFVGPPFV